MTDYKGQLIQGEVEESGVLHIRFNRPPVNAASGAFIFEIGHLFSLAKNDPDVRAIVLSSTLPKFFTAGLDLKEAGQSLDHKAADPARKALALKAHILGKLTYMLSIRVIVVQLYQSRSSLYNPTGNLGSRVQIICIETVRLRLFFQTCHVCHPDWQSAISQIEECDKPVIAAVSGIAYGLAVDICSACDIRYASPDAQFSIKVSLGQFSLSNHTAPPNTCKSYNTTHTYYLCMPTRSFSLSSPSLRR